MNKLTIVALSVLFAARAMAGSIDADAVVYGATAGGVTAAVAAARQGVKVLLIEPGRHVGGMLSGGLGHSDVVGQQNLIGGLCLEVYQRIAKHYGESDPKKAFDFEPYVAEQVLNELLREAGVRVVSGQHVESVTKRGASIMALKTDSGASYVARVFVDASYEGDLMAKARVRYTVGREGHAKYGEWLAGRMELLPGHHQFKFAVSPWRDGKLLPFITPQEKLVPTGEGDGKFQAYCFRLCLTDRPENRIPITKPDGYNLDDYELARRYIRAGGNVGLGIARLPNGKCDANSGGPVSSNLLGAAWEYPDASPQRRREIWDQHLRWAHGLVWFLQNDPGVPQKQRDSMRKWGLCKDEFQDTGGWPHQLYIREGRRMIGKTVVTQHDLEEHRTKPDSIGMGGYNIDIREVQWVSVRTFHFPKAADEVYVEGYVSQPVQPWQIPYRALLPRRGECDNLLVPV
ncbi:MAG: FAD-dependent oxidoreductase, partial [Verrucomicrobia bacterium]|nr:FAD-dependent oxidoreductase [Verrucomicrobiota bacterium]